jgi:nucleoside-diphosphate-sugar epimerase
MSGVIAVIGAGGFVGTRLIESLILDREAGVRAVVRAYRNLASLARFGPAVAARLADARDVCSLAQAIRGCAVVVNVTAGAPSEIFPTTKAIHEACLIAGVRRFLHMSSAVVYGEVADPNIHDDSPPLTRHWMPYARAKAVSEVWLRERMPTSPCQIVVLRPGIVWGVRSPHTMQVVKSLADKSAFLVDGGQGVFPSIYVDNLVACVRTCCAHDSEITGFYNVADSELVTWREFFAAFAEHLDCDLTRIATVSGRRCPWSVRTVVDYAQALAMRTDFYSWMRSRMPDAAKSRIKSSLADRYNYDRRSSGYVSKPRVDREWWHLQKVRHKLPTSKFARHFGFTPPVAFREGVRRTLGWLTSLGFVRPGAVAHAEVAEYDGYGANH